MRTHDLSHEATALLSWPRPIRNAMSLENVSENVFPIYLKNIFKLLDSVLFASLSCLKCYCKLTIVTFLILPRLIHLMGSKKFIFTCFHFFRTRRPASSCSTRSSAICRAMASSTKRTRLPRNEPGYHWAHFWALALCLLVCTQP